MGLKVKVMDGDKVEVVNIGGQAYSEHMAGGEKPIALNEMCHWSLQTRCAYLRTPQNLHSEIIISAVDSNAVRRNIWESFKLTPRAQLFIDGRIGGVAWKIFVARKGETWYEQHLHSDFDSVQDPCAKGPTVDVGMMVAAQIGMTVRNFLTGKGVRKYTVGSMLDGFSMEMRNV